jgi:hypothetical protein
MVIGNTKEGTVGYGKFLPTVLLVFQPTEWWVDMGANVHVTRVNLTNVLDEGLRIGEIGRRMNSKVRLVEISVYRK